ncbi:hypothetical protein HanOQP8_Chr10g0375551 [Helianthus annuus]|nr:hypothetical protein HanOQP8_Chr10g0375551 [Helianthus annuus]
MSMICFIFMKTLLGQPIFAFNVHDLFHLHEGTIGSEVKKNLVCSKSILISCWPIW